MRFARGLRGTCVSPGGGVVGTDRVNFSEGSMRFGECGGEADGFQQQTERFILPAAHAVEAGEITVWLGVGGFLRDPGALLVDVFLRLLVEREIDDVLAPETHLRFPISNRRTSITLVLVGPVLTRSP